MEPIKKENLSPETVEKLSKNKMPPFMNLDLISVPADKSPLDLSKKTNEQNPVPGVSKKTNESFKMDINKSQNVGKKSFQCDVCSKSFTKRKVWKRHTETVHNEVKSFECKFCKEGFTVMSSLKSHVDSVHEGKKPFQCNVCISKFSKKSNLIAHNRRVHEGDRPFKCDKCISSFILKGALTKHIANNHVGTLNKKRMLTKHENK